MGEELCFFLVEYRLVSTRDGLNKDRLIAFDGIPGLKIETWGTPFRLVEHRNYRPRWMERVSGFIALGELASLRDIAS